MASASKLSGTRPPTRSSMLGALPSYGMRVNFVPAAALNLSPALCGRPPLSLGE